MSDYTASQHCDVHGEYVSRRFGERWTGCPTCADEEYRIQRERERTEAERLARLDWLATLMRQSGIEARYADATFDTYQATSAEQSRVLAACRAFAGAFRTRQGSGLFLIGPPGTGKTHLLTAITRHVIHHHGAARIATGREIIRTLRDTWRKDSNRSEGDVIDDFTGLHLLCIDELGAGFGTDAEQAQLFEIIDARYSRQLPTLIGTNHNLPAIKALLGERNFDRLREGATVLVLDWPSHRGQQ